MELDQRAGTSVYGRTGSPILPFLPLSRQASYPIFMANDTIAQINHLDHSICFWGASSDANL